MSINKEGYAQAPAQEFVAAPVPQNYAAAPLPAQSVPYQVPGAQNQLNTNDKEFAVPWYGCGNIGTCLYSWFCPQCSMGTARNNLDGSDCCVTCFNMNPVVLRWATRSAYGIPGSMVDDCVLGLFCPVCTINQVAQTTERYGRANATTGPEFNTYNFYPMDGQDCCVNCLYSSCCLPCAIGTSLQQSMNMPFVMGCCCANFCTARNMLRYHYRLRGNDCMEDCVAPYGIVALTYLCSFFVPCTVFCSAPYFIAMVMLMVNDAKRRGNTGDYLAPVPAGQSAVVPTMAAYQQQPYAVVQGQQQGYPVVQQQGYPVVQQQGYPVVQQQGYPVAQQQGYPVAPQQGAYAVVQQQPTYVLAGAPQPAVAAAPYVAVAAVPTDEK